MEARSVDTVVDRIDAALSRIERALERSAAQTRDLASRHERLKASVSEAMGEIDALIAGTDE